jgi:hypothetical protein
MSMKNPLTLAGIEPVTFQFVAQHVNAIYGPKISTSKMKTMACKGRDTVRNKLVTNNNTKQ